MKREHFAVAAYCAAFVAVATALVITAYHSAGYITIFG